MITTYIPNPKMIGSNLVDGIPQSGRCPNECPECFFNHAPYVRMWKLNMPRIEDTANKVVAVNRGGNDSNNQRGWVIEATSVYEYKFYNTSIPYFEFPGPVVFTCNGPYTDYAYHLVKDVNNVMAVRIRTNTWNLKLVCHAVEYYTNMEIPVILTFMRYYDSELVKKPEHYEWKEHVTNSYWHLKGEQINRITHFYSDNPLVLACGVPGKNLCTDCQNCIMIYWDFMRRVVGVNP